jgi:hypothetical protein
MKLFADYAGYDKPPPGFLYHEPYLAYRARSGEPVNVCVRTAHIGRFFFAGSRSSTHNVPCVRFYDGGSVVYGYIFVSQDPAEFERETETVLDLLRAAGVDVAETVEILDEKRRPK